MGEKLRYGFLAVAIAAGGAADSAAQQQALPSTVDRIVFSPVEETVGGSVQVVGGETVNSRDWRTVLLSRIGWMLDRNGNQIKDRDGNPIPQTCTATLVGPGVALTAAHCVDREDGASNRLVSLRLTDKDGSHLTIDMTCTLPAGYLKAKWKPPTPRNEQDWSLCRFASPNGPPILKGLRYEVVDTGTAVAEGRPVLISGYGCKDLRMGADGLKGLKYDNVFTIADTKVDDPSYQGKIEINSDGVTRPSICFGDSGGPLMTGATTSAQGADVIRRIVAVNSSLQQRDAYFVSQMVPVAATSFGDFLATWLRDNHGAVVCGAPGVQRHATCRD